MYKTFMKHAERVTKNHTTEERPMLKGVKHYSDGSLAVTDSHRLYVAKDMHDKGDTLLTPKGKELDENYPNIHRLLPRYEAQVELRINIDEFIKATDIILTAAKITKEEPVMKFKHNKVTFESIEVKASYELSQSSEITFTSNAQYWLDALKMFKAFKYTEAYLHIDSPMRPFTLTSPDEKLLALLLPIRSYS